jgi:hypothetical protein
MELFVSYQNGLKNDRKFQTDSNGLKMIDRIYGHEGKYNEIPFNIEMNMYPTNRIIRTEDSTTGQELTVAIDRPSAATVLPSSEIFIHLQRATYTDDRKGMSERVIDKDTIVKKHVLFYGKDTLQKARALQIRDTFKSILTKIKGT